MVKIANLQIFNLLSILKRNKDFLKLAYVLLNINIIKIHNDNCKSKSKSFRFEYVIFSPFKFQKNETN